MRLFQPFVKLPFTFDHVRLAEEISQFDEQEWRAHPQGFPGNSSLVFVSQDGAENDKFSGPMQPSPRLEKTPYIRQVLGCFNTVIGRSRLMRLAPGASVSRHIDAHYFWRNHLRIHVPIITDPAVTFYCDQEEVHMAAGDSWTFNNWLVHSVENRSDLTRIHLVIDTVGSAEMWKLIKAANDAASKHMGFAAGEKPELSFENYRGMPVMPPAELSADLDQLVEDIYVSDSDESKLKTQLQSRTADFVHDWQSHWMIHGPSIAGFAGFKGLMESFRRDLEAVPEELVLDSNNYAFKRAALYTLDATLTAENLPKENEISTPGASAAADRPRFDRPVFIVAAPRSGSTLLFETLAINRELWSVGDESHKHFESIASLRPNTENPSNRLTADLATRDVTETLLDFFTADLVNCDGKMYAGMPAVSRPGELRFLEKTPKNALRIPFILKAFPDARFIFLFREARQNISSLLDSWRSKRYVTYPTLPRWPKNQPWSHLLIPGWQNLVGNSLAEVVTQQWLTTNQTILDDLQELPPERWCTIEYDALLANTGNELKRLCHFSQIIFGPRMQEVASRPLRPSKYTLTAPHPDKWKKNSAELEPVIPATEQMMIRLREQLKKDL